MNIGIIGQGFVGKAVYNKFKNFYKVLTYDLKPELCNSSYKNLVQNSKIIFVCVPTPMSDDGSCNLEIVENILLKLNNETNAIVVNKSTVIPGSTENFNQTNRNIDVVFNPEFLRERFSNKDFLNQNRIILGGPKHATSQVEKIYSNVFPGVKIIKTNSKEAEMVKYLTNSYLANKVSFANEIYQLCDEMKINYKSIVDITCLDDRIENSYWDVPGHDGDFGFGGRCLPKDLQALISLSEKLKTTNNLLKSIIKTNKEIRKNKNW